MDTVFVTGGSSILGHHVLRRLVSRVRVLAVVHRRKVEIPDAEIELLHGELAATVCDPVALQRAQIVLHMAAVTHFGQSRRILACERGVDETIAFGVPPLAAFCLCQHDLCAPQWRRVRTFQVACRGGGSSERFGLHDYPAGRDLRLHGSRGN